MTSTFDYLKKIVYLLAHLAKGNVSFCHHFASVVVRRPASVVRRPSSGVRKLFQKSSPLKLLHGLSWNFACMFFSVLAIKLLFLFLISWITWRLLLKIEHRVKTMFFANISKNMLQMKKAVTWKWSWDRDLPFLKISRKFKIFCRSYCPFCGFFGKIYKFYWYILKTIRDK